MVTTCKNWSPSTVSECAERADAGSRQCTSPFCTAWYWVAKWACRGFAVTAKAICVLFSYFLQVVCAAWDGLRCALVSAARRRAREPVPVEHVFVLMLENRSFDHVFGFSGLEGVDVQGNSTTLIGADPTRDFNADPANGVRFPVAPGADFALKGIDKDPGHEFLQTVVALCGAGSTFPPTHRYPTINNSGFVANYRATGSATPERIMRCFRPDQVPVLTELARQFAVCDNWFCSVPGPTWPNRLFAMAASSGGLDGSPRPSDIITSTTVEGYRFANGNIFDLLDEYCIDWRIFEGDEFPVSFAMSGMGLNALHGRFTDLDEFRDEVRSPDFSPKFVFIEPRYGAHGFDITGPGDFTCGNSMHPLDDVTSGERLVKHVYEAIRNSPHWERSLLVITFDEHGGFYDHVRPPEAVPPGDVITDRYVRNGFQFDVLGVRVPALVISPLIRRGVIDHTQYDHTSILATVERLFGMHSLTDRDGTAHHLLPLLSLKEPRTDTPTVLPDPAVNTDPLDCEEDDFPTLQSRRSDLLTARHQNLYRGRDIRPRPAGPTQIGFAQVALLRILDEARRPRHDRWIQKYASIESNIDAAIFMVDAKLKLRHDIEPPEFREQDQG